MYMDIEKLIEAVNYILKKYDYSLNFTKLIKLLYLADRQAIDETGMSITGDNYVAMNLGPVLSSLYDLIKNRYKDLRVQSLWNCRFITSSNEIKATSNKIKDNLLSIYEKKVLSKIDRKFHNFKYSSLINYVHNNCPEWTPPNGKSLPITLESILKALGKPQDEIEFILAEDEFYRKEEEMFRAIKNYE